MNYFSGNTAPILTLSSAVFIFFFSILLLCQLLIGETYLGIFSAGALVVLLMPFFWVNRKKTVLNHVSSTLIMVWVAYLATLVVSTVFSHSIPLSLQQLFFSGCYFVFFFFFLLIPKDFLGKILIGQIVFLVPFVVILMSIAVRFDTSWATKLPGMNLIYESYGHNHVAALIILINPLMIWSHFQKLKQEEKNPTNNFFIDALFKNKFLILFLLSNLVLLTTFARVGILIGFLQVIYVIVFLHNSEKTKVTRSLVTKSLIFFLALLFISILSVKLFFSFVYDFSSEYQCPVQSFERKLCKSITKDLRTEYWKQSLSAIHRYPILGYGPGTFSLVSQKFKLAPYAFTSFAHNAYLQTFAESGFIAGILFSFIFIYPIYRCLFLNKNFFKSDSLQTWVGISLISIFFDSLFDFDLSFSGVFLFTLLLSAIGLRLNEEVNLESPFLAVKNKLRNLPLLSLVVVSLMIQIFLLGFAISELLIANNQVSRAFSFFPLFYYQRNIFFNSVKNEDIDKEKIMSIYRFHPESYSINSQEYSSLIDKDLLFIIDPWKSIFSFIENSDEKNRDEFKPETIVNMFQFLLSKESQKDYQVLSYAQKKVITEKALIYADNLLSKNNTKSAAELYLLSYSYVNYSIQDHNSKFPSETIYLESFLKGLDSLPISAFGSQDNAFADQYFLLASTLLTERNLDQASWSFLKSFQIAPMKINTYWLSISKSLRTTIDFSLANNDEELAKDFLQSWKSVRNLAKTTNSQIDYSSELILANYLVNLSNRNVNDMSFLVDNYLTAVQIDPGIFSNIQPHLLDRSSVRDINTEDAQKYLDAIPKAPDIIGGRKIQTYELLLRTSLDLFLHDDFKAVDRYLAYAEKYDLQSSKTQLEFEIHLQSLAEEYVLKGENKKALQILKFMAIINPDDYWVVQQPGNLLLSLGMLDGMKIEYQYCADHFTGLHEECLRAGDGDKEKFLKVGKIIKREKTFKEVFP